MKPSDMPQVSRAQRESRATDEDGRGLVRLDTEMAGADLRLSFLTTLRRKKGRDKFLQLRSLLVRRLRPSAKAILRLRMRHNILTATTDKYQIFCEACLRWLNLVEWGEEFACPRCNSLYAIEFAVYTKIEEESE